MAKETEPMMMRCAIPIKIVLISLALTVAGQAQTNPEKVPRPPTAELKKLEQFLGRYTHTMNYGGLKWRGTMEINRAVKGWYIERVILTKTEGIDREFRCLITYDSDLKRYRLWRFETLPPLNNEGAGRFDGDEFVEEYELDEPDGSKVVLRNRTTRREQKGLRIVTELQDSKGKVTQIGITIARPLSKM